MRTGCIEGVGTVVFTHADILNDMLGVRAAIGRTFRWFIHVTPEKNLASIRQHGLTPRLLVSAPKDVGQYFGTDNVPILCLHPLGAEAQPRGTNGFESQESDQGSLKFVSFAFERCHLPMRLGLDWSLHPYLRDDLDDLHEVAIRMAHSMGSIVTYDTVPSSVLRVFATDCPPTDPLRWPYLNAVFQEGICGHK